jgi:hypothetical protein
MDTLNSDLKNLKGYIEELKDVETKIARYEKEQADIKAEAESLEKKRDDARAQATESSSRGGGMGYAVSIFQISIALGSTSLVTKKKPLWLASLALGAYAVVKMFLVWNK